MFEQVTLSQIIVNISTKRESGYEFLTGRFEGDKYVSYYFQPSDKLKDKFVQLIGDKYSQAHQGRLDSCLRNTNIKLDGKFASASGGLCPGSVRLLEIIDMENLEKIVDSHKDL